MSKTDKYILRGKVIITFSIALILISSGIQIYLFNNEDITTDVSYEDVNVKYMATANVSDKKEVEKTGISSIINNYQKETEEPKEVELPTINQNRPVIDVSPWRLPCEEGTITGGVTYSHYALDIVSPRGTAEAIYPVADGVISSIYTDSAGALIVTVNHNINGNLYTSQYVHLSKYESGIYVGKEVTTNDKLGYMGSTGIAYGTHLHLALLDCNSFSDDGRCSNLGSFFNYGRLRYQERFYGLQSVMNVPITWNSR